jgi:hypothetical protein
MLDECPRHDFSVAITEGQILNQKWKCINCGGVVDSIAKKWYEIGLDHAFLEVERG